MNKLCSSTRLTVCSFVARCYRCRSCWCSICLFLFISRQFSSFFLQLENIKLVHTWINGSTLKCCECAASVWNVWNEIKCGIPGNCGRGHVVKCLSFDSSLLLLDVSLTINCKEFVFFLSRWTPRVNASLSPQHRLNIASTSPNIAQYRSISLNIAKHRHASFPQHVLFWLQAPFDEIFLINTPINFISRNLFLIRIMPKSLELEEGLQKMYLYHFLLETPKALR